MKSSLNNTSVPMLLGGLLVIALTGGLYLYSQFEKVRDQRHLFEFFQLRQEFVGYIEAQRLMQELQRQPLNPENLRRYADFLTLRLPEITRSSNPTTREEQQRFVVAIEKLIGFARAAADGNAPQSAAIVEMQQSLHKSAVFLANHQFSAEHAFLAAQTEGFNRILLYASLIFALFVAIAGVAITMLSRETTARKKISVAEERSRYLAYNDSLTGVINRRSFNQKYEAAMKENSRLGVAVIDLDDFKNINDVYGHDVGDMLLREVAHRLQRTAERQNGFIARLGGDEFAAVIPLDVDLDDPIDTFCSRALCDAERPVAFSGIEIAPKLSIGAASSLDLKTDEALTPGRLLKAADRALYDAKTTGKNRCSRFDIRLEEEVRREQLLERDLERAIANEELFFVFQPQIDMTSGGLLGLETLARWNNRGEPVPPGVFIAAAERSGQVRAIDQLALKGAIVAMSQWRAEGLEHPRVSVNLSPVNFKNASIVSRVADLLNSYKVPPEKLCIEITENVVFEDFDRASELLRKLKDLGVALSLDDFGAGYSSIGQLRKMDVDELKIDRSLTNGVLENGADTALLASMASLADALNIEIVVEGVETVEQQQRLVELGYRNGQGFLFARPLPNEDVTRIIANGGLGESFDALKQSNVA